MMSERQRVVPVHVQVSADPAGAAAGELYAAIDEAIGLRGRARIAVSGGSTSPALFARLQASGAALDRVEVWQVDERIVPDGDPDRNLSQLAGLPWTIHAMPVTDDDLITAADRYAAGLPERFDVVHLGVGPDGHTASWPPGDPVLRCADDQRVALVDAFRGHDRMTITPPVVRRARRRLVLVTGSSKTEIVRRWLVDGDDLPAALIPSEDTSVHLDPAAAAQLPQRLR
jgi:6-phosphogluconolactonase/glucosamine-6-phosphate isomerase/deaminase